MNGHSTEHRHPVIFHHGTYACPIVGVTLNGAQARYSRGQLFVFKAERAPDLGREHKRLLPRIEMGVVKTAFEAAAS